MGAGGDHRERLVPALHKYCKGWYDHVGKLLCAPESYKAMILLFIMWHVLMLEKLDAEVCGWYFTLLLPAPAALGTSS